MCQTITNINSVTNLAPRSLMLIFSFQHIAFNTLPFILTSILQDTTLHICRFDFRNGLHKHWHILAHTTKLWSRVIILNNWPWSQGHSRPLSLLDVWPLSWYLWSWSWGVVLCQHHDFVNKWKYKVNPFMFVEVVICWSFILTFYCRLHFLGHLQLITWVLLVSCHTLMDKKFWRLPFIIFSLTCLQSWHLVLECTKVLVLTPVVLNLKCLALRNGLGTRGLDYALENAAFCSYTIHIILASVIFIVILAQHKIHNF